MSSEPPVATPKIEKTLQLKQTMDEISGHLPHEDPKYRHQNSQSIPILFGGFFLFAVPWMISGLYSELLFFAGFPVLVLGILLWSWRQAFHKPGPSFVMDRTSFKCGGKTYAWTRIKSCTYDQSKLVLTLKDGQPIVLIQLNEHIDSLQWVCERINHRAGLAGDEAEVPEDIKAMRRQNNSV